MAEQKQEKELSLPQLLVASRAVSECIGNLEKTGMDAVANAIESAMKPFFEQFAVKYPEALQKVFIKMDEPKGTVGALMGTIKQEAREVQFERGQLVIPSNLDKICVLALADDIVQIVSPEGDISLSVRVSKLKGAWKDVGEIVQTARLLDLNLSGFVGVV